MFRVSGTCSQNVGPSTASLTPPLLQCHLPSSLFFHSIKRPTHSSPELKYKYLLSLTQPQRWLKLKLVMSQNFTLSPEDLLLWQSRAPCASWWLGVSNHHPFINGGQPMPPTLPPGTPLPSPQAILPSCQATMPPPPYTSIPPLPLPTPALQPYLAGGQPGIFGAVLPAVVTPFPPGNLAPTYDIHHQNNTAPAVIEDPSPPSHKLKSNLTHDFIINETFAGFVVSVPLTQLSLQDTPSWAEI